MPNLILIKHAQPLVEPDVPSDQWRLSPRGVELCGPLAERLRALEPSVIISSREPKAVETAAAAAQRLKLPHEQANGLHEHDRSNVPHMRSAEFISMVELFFRKPDELVLGRETANQALARFSSAVDSVLNEHLQDNVAIVSHGTVIALFVAQHSERSGFELWRKLGLPSFVVLSRPELRVETIVDRIEEDATADRRR
jgi:broad specificity phosphatase PhoE